jgi:hypothetical protein
MAFPYKPEEVYSMDYETFLVRVAQAESKLIKLKMITEPIYLQNIQAQPEQRPKRLLDNIDPKALWDATHPKDRQQTGEVSQAIPRDKWWKISPVLEAKKKHNINFSVEKQAADSSLLDNHENAEPKEVREYLIKQKAQGHRAKLIEDARWIYKDLLAELEKKQPK